MEKPSSETVVTSLARVLPLPLVSVVVVVRLPFTWIVVVDVRATSTVLSPFLSPEEVIKSPLALVVVTNRLCNAPVVVYVRTSSVTEPLSASETIVTWSE